MVITICILILFYTLLGKPVGELLNTLKGVDWSKKALTVWTWVKKYALKSGRAAAVPVFTFWYVLQDENTSTFERALIYAALFYIAVPNDLMPRKTLKFIGILDDFAVGTWLYKKIESKVTDEIRKKVADRISELFGSKDEKEGPTIIGDGVIY